MEPPQIVTVLIVGLSYGARNVLLYTRSMMQNFLAFRDSPTIPLRRSSIMRQTRVEIFEAFRLRHVPPTTTTPSTLHMAPTYRECVHNDAFGKLISPHSMLLL